MAEKTQYQTFKIFRCSVCGNLIVKLNDSGITPQCCGRDMNELDTSQSEGALERHIPVWWMEGCKVVVNVGDEPHPMISSHFIQWIMIITNKGFSAKHLTPDDNPEACFKICKQEYVKEVIAYCNIHGLYKAVADDKKGKCEE